ncbi:MAG: transporter [Luteolibacter sp.]
MKHLLLKTSCLAAITGFIPSIARAEDDAAELAKKLSNPIANLISVPLQSNWDFGIGPADATMYTLKIQPVIPFTLNQDWNLITRTILPVIDLESPVAGGDDKFGLGDTTQSFFFSPKAPTSNGWIWGAGPAFLWPTATDDALGSEQWSAGPTVVLLRQDSGWTYGLLANQLWSYAGNDNNEAVNATFLQPFLSYQTKTMTTFGVNTESTYDWTARQWTVPINAYINQMVKIGGQPISFQLGYRYFADGPEGGPDWGLRFGVTFLFPKS